jgi:hypothetical protein
MRWRLSPAAEVVSMLMGAGTVCAVLGLAAGVWIGGRAANARARETEAARAACAKSLATERDLLGKLSCAPGRHIVFLESREHGPTVECVPSAQSDGGITWEGR